LKKKVCKPFFCIIAFVKKEIDMNIEDLKKIKEQLNKQPIKHINKHLVFSIDVWRHFRIVGACWALWTDEELINHNKKTGLIGSKCGVDCYVQI
jgi:hypothetical protein